MENQRLENKIANVMIALGCTLVLILIFTFIFKHVYPDLIFPKILSEPSSRNQLLVACILAPITEELMFRHLPLKILSKLVFFEEIKWYIVAMIAVIFGMFHGHITNIFVQGVAGFFFGWVYIKNQFSYWSAVITHSLYNLIVLFIIPIILK